METEETTNQHHKWAHKQNCVLLPQIYSVKQFDSYRMICKLINGKSDISFCSSHYLKNGCNDQIVATNI